MAQPSAVSNFATLYFEPSKALAQASGVRVLPAAITTVAVFASKSTSTDETPSISDRAALTRSSHPPFQFVPSTLRMYFAADCAAGAAVSGSAEVAGIQADITQAARQSAGRTLRMKDF